MKRRAWIAVALVLVTTAVLWIASLANCIYSGQECWNPPTCNGQYHYCMEGYACPPDYDVDWESCGCCGY